MPKAKQVSSFVKTKASSRNMMKHDPSSCSFRDLALECSYAYLAVLRNEIGVAPGLSVSIDVEFLTRKPYDYVDKLVITAEAENLAPFWESDPRHPSQGWTTQQWLLTGTSHPPSE